MRTSRVSGGEGLQDQVGDILDTEKKNIFDGVVSSS